MLQQKFIISIIKNISKLHTFYGMKYLFYVSVKKELRNSVSNKCSEPKFISMTLFWINNYNSPPQI